ncbi:hypothetical protein ABNA15_004568 [Escherichia coli]
MTLQITYKSEQGCVSWQGHCVQKDCVFNDFLQGPVAARLNDTTDHDALTEHLRELSLTGMGHDSLEEVLAAEVPETRDCAVGKALAEAVLEALHDVVLPWYTECGKRNPFASLPDANIVGFQRDDESHQLSLGEVKCSSATLSPPQLISGRSSMTHQLDTLASNLANLCLLLKWLLSWGKSTEHETAFNNACTRYFNSGNRDLVLFGILIRDQSVNETDLRARCRSLAGRVFQGQLGIVALVAKDEREVAQKKGFINQNTGDLNSALIQIMQTADGLECQGSIVYHLPEWSSFLQCLTHTYRQMGQPSNFVDQIEQVLRGTFGFEKLRTSDSQITRCLLDGIHRYVDYLASPSQLLKLVDSTGFSLQSIRTVLTHKGDLRPDSWNREQLFSSGDNTLKNMMGVLMRVPELRDNLNSVLEGKSPDGGKLACILKDWGNGKDIAHIAKQYFSKDDTDVVTALTKCGQNLLGKLTHTTS